MNTHLKAEGNLEQVGQANMSIKQSILALKGKLPSEKKSIKLSHQSLEKQNSETTFHL